MDYLKNECEKLGIKLIYSSNKVLILSGSVIDNEPTIKAHEVFKKCSEEVADSIIDYYINLKHNNNSINIIKDFVKLNYTPAKYKIKPPDKTLLSYFKDYTTTLVEYEISEIIKSNFYGNTENIKPSSSFKASDDDVVELDIIVKPPG